MNNNGEQKISFSAALFIVILFSITFIAYNFIVKDNNISDVNLKQDSVISLLRTDSVTLPIVWGI